MVPSPGSPIIIPAAPSGVGSMFGARAVDPAQPPAPQVVPPQPTVPSEPGALPPSMFGARPAAAAAGPTEMMLDANGHVVPVN